MSNVFQEMAEKLRSEVMGALSRATSIGILEDALRNVHREGFKEGYRHSKDRCSDPLCFHVPKHVSVRLPVKVSELEQRLTVPGVPADKTVTFQHGHSMYAAHKNDVVDLRFWLEQQEKK